jgi:competence protein ComFC
LFSYRCAGCGQLARKSCDQCASKIALLSRPYCSDAIVALSYVGLVRDLMLAFKYRNHRTLATLFADLLVATVRTSSEIKCIDVVTWVPTTRERRTARGHDQAETLARIVGRSLGVPVRKLLARETVGHQTGQSRENRLVGVSLRARSMNTPSTVLVVDDVVTTGATMRIAQRVLYQAGAARVICAAVASTPAPARRG